MSGCHHSPASVVILNVQSKAASVSPREGSIIETEEEISPPGDQNDSKAKACRNKARKWDFDCTDKMWWGQGTVTSDM